GLRGGCDIDPSTAVSYFEFTTSARVEVHVPIPSRNLPWAGRLRLPAIAAPMTSVSTPELVIAACRSGVIGSFPTHNAATTRELDDWLSRAQSELAADAAPVAPNLVVHRSNPRR